jgi:hypothetical protein
MWKASDFCDADSGFDYIFGYMNAIYGSRFISHWQDIDPGLVRQIWKEQLGVFLTYKPSLDHAIKHLDGDFPPSAIKFRDYCNSGPEIPAKPLPRLERKPTLHEQIQTSKAKAEALAKFAEFKSQLQRKS